MVHETKVRDYYDKALDCYRSIMGDRWHFGDPESEAKGLSPTTVCEVMEEKIVKLTELGPGKRALDFGSGIGGPTIHMAKVSGASFIGVTNNPRLTATANENAASQGLSDRAKFLEIEDTGYQALPFPDGHFDAVTTYDAVCHLTDKAIFFREVYRVLKPGGIFAGTDWLQRPFGEYQTEEQIMKFMRPVNENAFIPWHGTLEGHRKMITDAKLDIFLVQDLYEGVRCWGTVSDKEHEGWLTYEGKDEGWFREGKRALDRARHAGVFTVGMFAARKSA